MERRIGWLLALGPALVSLTGSVWGAEYETTVVPAPHDHTIRGTRWPSHYHLSVGDIVARLRFSGMDLVSAPVLHGSTYVLEAVKRDGAKVRLALDATTGDRVAGRSAIGSQGRRSTPAISRLRVAHTDGRSLIRPPQPVPRMPEVSGSIQRSELATRSFDFAFAAPFAINVAGGQTGAKDIEADGHAPAEGGGASIVLLVADGSSERSGYQAVTIQPKEIAPTGRRHELFATCVATEPQGKTGFIFLTNAPEALDQIGDGDTVQVTGPRCASLGGEQGDGSRVMLSIRKTALVATNMAPPRLQYVMMGNITSPPSIAHLTEPTDGMVQDCDYCPQLMRLPGGGFSMGGGSQPDEQPVHRATIEPFALSRYPVTVSQWRQCVLAAVCSYEPIRGSNYSDTPVHNVSFEDAQSYVAWLSETTKQPYRLPTEAEFEYAARGGSDADYWWGSKLVDGMANCRQCGEPFSPDMPVISVRFAANPFGLYGVSGGVAQWVADCWHETYEGAPQDGSAWVTPVCTEHVLRAGSWLDEPSRLRAASRDHAEPDRREPGYGFRVARAL
jgi:formylglycine-generating enzyme required for sulfatase activity